MLKETLLILSASLASTSLVLAEQHIGSTYTTQIEADFEDTKLDLESAIVNQGLVIDYTGNVGAMLERTSDVVEEKSPYSNAAYMQFCSATHTHAAVSASIENISICPYVVFVYESNAELGKVTVGYRRPVGIDSPQSVSALQKIDDLLKGIIDEATQN